jgi:ribosome-associated translation inhibitor RaiA
MAMPVYVNFHNMKRCEKLENAIFLRAGKLKTLYGGATSCRVAVIASKHHENRLKVLDVVVDLSIPGKDFVARSRAEDEVCPNASVAVADAFKRTARRLRDHRSKQMAFRTRTMP